MLKRYGFDILGEAGVDAHNTDIPRLPSWVAGWTQNCRSHMLLNDPRPTHYHATRSKSPVLMSPEFSSPLRPEGPVVDVVKACTDPLRASDGFHRVTSAITIGNANWYLATTALADSLPPRVSQEDRFWKTVTVNCTLSGAIPPSS